MKVFNKGFYQKNAFKDTNISKYIPKGVQKWTHKPLFPPRN